ncbi:Adenine deaminase [Parafrankia sp. EUN1f]|nr:Adenine deaminase [Parafrankia sp. EUN1f]
MLAPRPHLTPAATLAGESLGPSPAEIERLRAIALGQAEADFAIRGGVVLVVQTGDLVRRDVIIAGRYIAAVTRPGALEARRSLDAAGRFVLPAYVDARTSVERTLLSPGELARLVVPRGTVTVLTDPAQIEQMYGASGRALVLGTGTPMRVLPRGPVEARGADPAESWTGSATEAGAGVVAAAGTGIAGSGIAGSGAAGAGVSVGVGAGVDSGFISQAVPRQVNPLEGLAGGLPATPQRPVPLTAPAPHLVTAFPGLEMPAPPLAGASAFPHLDDQVRAQIRAGGGVGSAVLGATLDPARAFGLDHVLGLIAPARLADLQIVRDLTAGVPPDVVIAGGRIAAERGRALFDNLDVAPEWAQSSVRLPAGLYTGSFTSPCMHWGGRRDTSLGVVDVSVPGDGGTTSAALLAPVSSPVVIDVSGGQADRPRVSVARIEPTLRDGVVVADPSRDLLKTAVLDRTGRADRVRVGMVRGIGLTRGALGASAAAAPGDLVIVGAGDADMLTAARALEGMGGGFVVVDRGWVLAACPLPVAGLMSDAPWEAVLGQLAAVDSKARELGCRLASPLRTIARLGRELYIRP